MANHRGAEGVVKIGTSTISEVRSWEIEETMSPLEDTSLGDTAKTFQTGMTEWSGAMDAFWDETDSSGQGAMTTGASVAMKVYPEGAASADTYYSGTALITSIARRAAHDGLVEVSFSFQGTGALTASTV